jgi:hypothetical protein
VLGATPLVAQMRHRVAVTMDDVLWQSIPEDRRPEAEFPIRPALPIRLLLFYFFFLTAGFFFGATLPFG